MSSDPLPSPLEEAIIVPAICIIIIFTFLQTKLSIIPLELKYSFAQNKSHQYSLGSFIKSSVLSYNLNIVKLTPSECNSLVSFDKYVVM